MSLLMQALKKAERARQSGLQEEDLPDSGLNNGLNNGIDDGLGNGSNDAIDSGTGSGIDYGFAGRDGDGQPGADGAHGSLPRGASQPGASATPAGRTPGSSGGGLELSLEPLDAAPPRTEPAFAEPSLAEPSLTEPARAAERPRPPPPPAIEPALEATHNPVPPQARHEGGRARADAGEIPVADARAAARPAGAAADTRRGPGAPERRAVPRTAPVQADAASGIDLPRLRVAGLAGVLMIVAGTFGYLYWQAVSGPGPGASLPMVPMPPPSATGATGAAGTGTDGGIVVAPPGAPSGPPFGPLGPSGQGADATGMPGQAAPAPVAAMAPPSDDVAPSPDPAMPVAEPAPVARPAPRAARAASGPSAAQLAAIEDPEIRREALRDAMERADRSRQMERTAAAAEAPPVPFAIDGGPPAAPAAATTASTAPDGGRGDVHVARGSSTPAISPAVQAGYAAFAAGDLAAASRQYGTALRNDPNNRDALLGSAAIAARERRDDEAARLYLRLLAIDPRDADAIAGLTALRPGDGDRAEVRLKGILRDNPNAAPVHFALGNLYARQRRWQEAQQAYFHAWSAAPGNADYAFNLAVGLDRLNQGRLAREYYQRALALAADGAAAFDRAAVQRRLLELAPAAGTPAPVPANAPAPATLQAPAPVPAAAGN